MQADLMTIEAAGAVASRKPFSRDQVHLIKTQIARECTDDELAMFLGVCERTGLDPFARQIYAIKRFDKDEGAKRMVIQTGIDGYRLIADRTGRYAGSDEPVYAYSEQGHLIKATVTVYKLVNGLRCGFTASALMDEYKPIKPGPLWNRMPHTMLSKSAEALALRKAFPADLSGLYTHEEMDQAGHQAPAHEPAQGNGHTPVNRLPQLDAPPAVEMVTKMQLSDMNGILHMLDLSKPERDLWAKTVKEKYTVGHPKELTKAQAIEVLTSLKAALDAHDARHGEGEEAANA